MRNQRQDYVSYLLRFWRTGGEEDGVWRGSLTNPFTGQSLGFATMEELLAFLRSQVDDKERRAPEEEGDGAGV